MNKFFNTKQYNHNDCFLSFCQKVPLFSINLKPEEKIILQDKITNMNPNNCHLIFLRMKCQVQGIGDNGQRMRINLGINRVPVFCKVVDTLIQGVPEVTIQAKRIENIGI